MLESFLVLYAVPMIVQAQIDAGAQTRAVSLMETHRPYVIAAVFLVLAQGALIAALLASRARRRETEARNSAILRAIPDMMFVQTRDGVFLDYSVKDRQILLAPPEEFMGKNMRDILPPAIHRRIAGAVDRLFQGQEPAVVEYDLQAPSGEVRYYEARLVRYETEKFVTIVRDITDRRQAESAMHEEQLRHRLATAAGGVGVWDWNIVTGDFYVDAELKARLGYDDFESWTHIDDWRRLIHPDDLAHGIDIKALIDQPTSELEQRMLHKDGSSRWFLVRGAVARSEHGIPTRLIGTSSDITDRKHAAEALDRAEAELLRASKLATLGEFAGSIAHELAQPLTAVIANAHACLRLLDRPGFDRSTFEESLRDVLTSGEIARDVIAHTRQLFGNRRLERISLDLADVVNETRMMAEPMLRARNIALEVLVTPAFPAVRGDRVQLRQVLLNLVTNAIQSMEQLEPGLPRRLSIGATLDARGYPTLTVADTGVGFGNVKPDELIAGSFTTKPDGMGWGLSISRSIIEAHGGRLWAEPNRGGGAVFSFSLPLDAKEAPPSGSEPPVRRRPSPPGIRLS